MCSILLYVIFIFYNHILLRLTIRVILPVNSILYFSVNMISSCYNKHIKFMEETI